MIRIFVSSVRREFALEGAALRDYARNNPVLRRFSGVFLFEDAPATDRRPDELYLDEVERCDIYVGLFGDEYGNDYVRRAWSAMWERRREARGKC